MSYTDYHCSDVAHWWDRTPGELWRRAWKRLRGIV